MAKRTAAAASKPARQLGELLQEQQEPFILEIYLSERGCVRTKLSSGANFFGCHGNSGKFLKKCGGNQNKSKRKGIPNFPKVLCHKFFAMKGLRTKNSDDEDGKLSVTEMERNNQETAEQDRFSTASNTTMYDSCSDCDIDEPSMLTDNPKFKLKLYHENEKKIQSFKGVSWKISNQHSPQSVLEEILSTSTSSQLDNTRRGFTTMQKSFFLPKLIMEESILSASLWNLLLHTTPDKSSTCEGLRELQEPDWSNSSPFSISKTVLQRTKQLQFDWAGLSADNNHENVEKRKEFLRSGEIGKVIICEKMKDLGRRCGDESNTMKLLGLDLMDSTQEWNDFEHQKKDIVLVIGNAIVEEITTEVAMDMIKCPIAKM